MYHLLQSTASLNTKIKKWKSGSMSGGMGGGGGGVDYSNLPCNLQANANVYTFYTISAQVEVQRSVLTDIENRVQLAQGKVNHLKGSKKAIQVSFFNSLLF